MSVWRQSRLTAAAPDSRTGPIESGVLRTGEEIEIWDGHQLIPSARAQAELIHSRDVDPRSIALLLGEVDKNLLAPGHKVRRAATKK